MSMKNSNDAIWNRTKTFRFVAQHLNHCATPPRSPGRPSNLRYTRARTRKTSEAIIVSQLEQWASVGNDLYFSSRQVCARVNTVWSADNDWFIKLTLRIIPLIPYHDYDKEISMCTCWCTLPSKHLTTAPLSLPSQDQFDVLLWTVCCLFLLSTIELSAGRRHMPAKPCGLQTQRDWKYGKEKTKKHEKLL